MRSFSRPTGGTPPKKCPRGDTNFSARGSVIKKTFTQRYLSAGGAAMGVSAGKLRERRRGVWQRRFGEHTIEDEQDFETHFDYIHYNPVKHRLVRCPREWEPSSLHRWSRRGVYPADWGCGRTPPPVFEEREFGEPA